MSCPINQSSFIRHLYFQCQQDTLTKFNIPQEKIITINNITYLVVSCDSNYYTRTTTDKSKLVDIYNSQFVYPNLVRVGFSVQVIDNYFNVRACLEYLATASISTSYGNSYTGVTVIDNIRPEVGETSTTRLVMLTVGNGQGTTGIDLVTGFPLFTEEYTIEVVELSRRLSM